MGHIASSQKASDGSVFRFLVQTSCWKAEEHKNNQQTLVFSIWSLERVPGAHKSAV